MNYKMKHSWLFILVFIGLMLGGCAATVPMMSVEQDAAAKTFQTASGKANIYIVRKQEFAGSAVLFDVDLNGRSFGGVAPGTYHLLELSPGKYTVSVTTRENRDHEIIEAAEGKNYFVEIKPKMGWIAARVSVDLIDPVDGEKLVMGCKRAETLLVE